MPVYEILFKRYEWEEHGHYCVYEIGIYEKGSVLEGQVKNSYLGRFNTVKEAKKEYLGAYEVGGLSKAIVPLNPPPDFDYLDAGEYWSEDDY